PPGLSRQRPDSGLTRVPLVCTRQTWAPVALQSYSWISVPLPVTAAVTARHLPSARTDPSPGRVHCWAGVPLQSYSCTGVPLAELAARTSTHLPPMPGIGRVAP